MTWGLLAGHKQRLWRVSSAFRRWAATSASSSRTPVTLRRLCWMSSANERVTSSFSHRPSTPPPPPALGTGTETKAWRKLFWEQQKKRVSVSCDSAPNGQTHLIGRLEPFAGGLCSRGTWRGLWGERRPASGPGCCPGRPLRPASWPRASESYWRSLSILVVYSHRENCMLGERRSKTF